jgi:2,3-bisphosphoglycerate-dependent phosphoglycerate mutase
MSKLIMMRHGQSTWNKLNLFTGWVDIPLSEEGIQEAIEGGQNIKNIPIDVVFTSSLIRSIMTAMLVMNQHCSEKVPVILHQHEELFGDWSKIYSETTQQQCIPVIRAWELNERMYGELQGLNKEDTIKKYGAEQVQLWRRSYNTCPPKGESLAMTAERSIPYFRNTIVPYLEQGQNVFISAHGNSLRSIVMFLEGLSQEQVIKLELATGHPLIYTYEQGLFKRVENE